MLLYGWSVIIRLASLIKNNWNSFSNLFYWHNKLMLLMFLSETGFLVWGKKWMRLYLILKKLIVSLKCKIVSVYSYMRTYLIYADRKKISKYICQYLYIVLAVYYIYNMYYFFHTVLQIVFQIIVIKVQN